LSPPIGAGSEFLKYAGTLLERGRSSELEELCTQDVSALLGVSGDEEPMEPDSRLVRPPDMTSHLLEKGGQTRTKSRPAAEHSETVRATKSVGVVFSRRPSREETETTAGTIQIFAAARKFEWRVDILPRVDTIVLADSNMRAAEGLPAGWQLVVLPGAKFRHVIEAIEKGCRSDHRQVETAYLQVGVNHRDDKGLAEPEFKETLRQVRRIARTVRYVGMSHDERLPGRVQDNIRRINRAWKDLADGYVRPLDVQDVRIDDSHFGVHHDKDTVAKVVRSIVDYHSTHTAADK
jgi:hypothetical protein